MAKSSKKRTKSTRASAAKAKATEAVEVTVDDAMSAETVALGDGDLDGVVQADPLSDADFVDENIADLDVEVVSEEAVRVDDVIADDATGGDLSSDSTPNEIVEPVVAEKSGSGFMPLVFGGAIAGAIGYGIATYFPLFSDRSDELTTLIETQADQLSAQSEQIAALEARLDMPAEEPDFSAVDAQIEAVGTELSSLSENVDVRFGELQTRMTDFEKQPNSDGTLSETALAVYQQELEDLRAEIDSQKEDVMSAAAQAEADLATARAEAAELEAAALAATEAAAARAAINRVATAVDTGAPFADALADLGGDVPAVLTDAANDGVATSAELTSDFPAAARAALSVARAEGVSDDASGLGGFFRNQFDVRSTTPQEGDGPDAVLSRAEAAAKEGRIADALAEIEALPEVARAEITDWTARAQQRADVLSAIATLSETYN